MTSRTESMQQWERAEIARSSVEATLTADRALRVSAETFARYACPARDTAYPLEYAFHELGDIAGRRVVDFGCGSGANSVLLTGRGAQVCGIDISEDLLRLALRRVGRSAATAPPVDGFQGRGVDADVAVGQDAVEDMLAGAHVAIGNDEA